MTCLPGILVEHPWLGLEAGRPGRLHQRGQVWPPRPVLPRLRLLHHGEQHDDHQLARNHSWDAPLEEGLPFHLQQSCPRRDSLPNFCWILFSGAKKTASAKFTSFTFQEVAEICYLRLNLLLVAVEARKYEGGAIDINPNGKKITSNAIGLFISDSSDKVKRAWFYRRLVLKERKIFRFYSDSVTGYATRT